MRFVVCVPNLKFYSTPTKVSWYSENIVMNPPLHVEVVQKKQSHASKEDISNLVHSFLANFTSLCPGAHLGESELTDSGALREHVSCLTLCDVEHVGELRPADTALLVHVHRLHEGGAQSDTVADAGGEDCSLADTWTLPARELHGLWESLVFENALKRDTVRFVETALQLAERGVDAHLVGCNRVVLLHGPPGTGKTSLCRALAHKLSVRLGERYPRACLVEINAHGLFSRWFSESGKLVTRLFERVQEVAADGRVLTCVLVDEVESLAVARRAALAGLEPSDSIRAVNALLTQLDRLRRLPNVLVLTTSNLTGAIDVAFADRADIKRLVAAPSARAAYEILRSCCAELAVRGVLADGGGRLFALRALEGSRWAESTASRPSLQLWATAQEAAAAGLSARALRRLPFLALALHSARETPPLPDFVSALAAALVAHRRDADDFAAADLRPASLATCNGLE